MRSTLTLTLALLLATIASASAEFVMLTPQSQPPQADASAELHTTREGTSPPRPVPDPAKPVAHKKRTGAIARGFGRSVPLSFAVRQIVPPSIKVRYAASADSDALVEWQGGREWRVVLQDAVRPLGLRVTVRGSTALISK